ncbi:MAG: DEAD/DEAH box helicase [Desulfomonilia bacterium]
MEQFRNLGLSETTLTTLVGKGFLEPTPIQRKIIPQLLSHDHDLVAQADTGTGKTAAFGIPIIECLDVSTGGVKALILVPTRELALQVAQELKSLKGARAIEIVAVYGGQSIGIQMHALRRGADIVVGTTGRILDHLRRGSLCLKMLSYLVLDEADEMLDMGFIEDIEAILTHVPAGRQTMLFSATMPRQVVSIARRFMGDYKTIVMNREKNAQQLTDQMYFEIRDKDKLDALCRIIDMEEDFYGLVFCRTRAETSLIAEMLLQKGYAAEGIHGDIDQVAREQIMRRFRGKHTCILVATDVAARGIDVSDLTHVINYSMPQDPDAYLHRIGRTGRAGKKGIAITFVTSRDYHCLSLIRRTTGRSLRKGIIPTVSDILTAKHTRIRNEIMDLVHEEKKRPYTQLAQELLASGDAVDIVAACLLHGYKNELDRTSYKEIRTLKPADSPVHARLFVARGRRHGFTPQKLSRFIHQKTGVKETLIQNIEMMDDFTYLSVPLAEADHIQKKFRQRRGRPLISKARPAKGQLARG